MKTLLIDVGDAVRCTIECSTFDGIVYLIEQDGFIVCSKFDGKHVARRYDDSPHRREYDDVYDDEWHNFYTRIDDAAL